MKRAIAYIRVSGLGQADKDGESRQSESIRTFCVTNGLQYWEQRFEVISGTVEGLDRPVFSEVLELIASQEDAPNVEHLEALQKTDRPCIVVERMDRFARDLMVQELLLRECRERGIEVYAADQPFIDIASDLGDPTRKLFRQILGALAEWEKSALVLKLRKARDRKRAETGRCEGVLPYHLTAEGMAVIKRIEAGRESGVSVPGIARRLNESGLTTRNGKGWTKRAVLRVWQKWKGVRT
jgi:DNA invertase Pin-like site-specific DNA recombinase